LALLAQHPPHAPECPFEAAVRAAAWHATGRSDEAALWGTRAERFTQDLDYPDTRLERLVAQVCARLANE
jgi:hypothetical protein